MTKEVFESMEIIKKARQIIDEQELDCKYGYIGIRVQEVPFELGEIDHTSHIWDNCDDTGIELDGICATNIECKQFTEYFGDHVALICGNKATFGEEVGELIIEDAVVEYIFC